MFSKIIMSICALLAGCGVSAGVFAFVLVIGVIPRMSRLCKINSIILVENVMICGVIWGNLSSFMAGSFGFGSKIKWLIAIYGICVGIFVGSIAVALAEILHTFPIIFKRMNLRAGLSLMVISMLSGKWQAAFIIFFIIFSQPLKAAVLSYAYTYDIIISMQMRMD